MKSLVYCCLFLVAAASTMIAQNATGAITGIVRDPSNAVLPGAQITVTNEETGMTRKAEANSEGEYRVPFLPVGAYSVRTQKGGFKSQVQTKVRLEILQVFKDFRFTERQTLAFQWEMFNAWNHAQFSDFNRTAQFDLQGNLTNLPTSRGGTGGRYGFGAITSARDPRLIQLAAKFYF